MTDRRGLYIVLPLSNTVDTIYIRMLMIRLQRLGKKKNAFYRFVVSEKGRDTQGKSLEILGEYNPIASPKVITLKQDRVKYWLGKGAQTSATVHNIFLTQGLAAGRKAKSVRITKRRQAKIDEKRAAAAPAPAAEPAA